MLSLAEYLALSSDLQQLGRQIEDETERRIEGLNKREAIAVARALAQEYQDGYRRILTQGLEEASRNAAMYYNKQIGSDLDVDDVVDTISKLQWRERFFGLTLPQRLAVNQRRLTRSITQSAQVDVRHLTNVYTETFPFGAHHNIDKRVLLGSIVKVEQDTAKHFAKKEGVPLIRWTLSHRHSMPDVCDDLASAINKDVTEYLNEQGLVSVDPRGLFFADKLPHPPHPNCQCEYMLVTEKGEEAKKGTLRRTLRKVISLLRKIRRK